MILSKDGDIQYPRIHLSTAALELTPGDMLRDPQLVFSKAEEGVAAFRLEKASKEEREAEAMHRTQANID